MVVDVRAGEDARACRAAWRLDDHEARVSQLPEISELMYKRKTTILQVRVRVSVELACSYGVLEGPRVRQPAAVAPPRADLNSYTETNLWCFKSYSLTGAHWANHNIAHVKHDGTTMVPHYSRSLLCMCPVHVCLSHWRDP